MTRTPQPSTNTRDLFEEEWDLSRRPFAGGIHAALTRGGVEPERCPVHMLPHLMQTLSEHGNPPASSCGPVIRRLIEELAGARTRAIAERDPIHRAALDEYAGQITLVLERVQARAGSSADVERQAG